MSKDSTNRASGQERQTFEVPLSDVPQFADEDAARALIACVFTEMPRDKRAEVLASHPELKETDIPHTMADVLATYPELENHECFSRVAHQAIWLGLLTLWANEQPTDPITLKDWLFREGHLAAAQTDFQHLETYLDCLPAYPMPLHYAGIVVGHYKRRQRYKKHEAALLALARGDDYAHYRLMQELAELEQEDTLEESRFRFMQASEVVNLPPMEWLIGGILPKRGLSEIWGKPGSGKSLILLDMAGCVGMGIAWRGHPVTQTTVAYICAEGLDGFSLRLKAWLESHDLPLDALDGNLFVLGKAPLLLVKEDFDAVMASLRALPKPPGFVIIDTLARVTAGSDENSQTDMGLFVQAADAIKNEFGAQVLTAHHPDASGQHGRGSTVLPGAFDTIMKSEQEGKTGKITLECEKQKDGASPFQNRHFQLQQVSMDMVASLTTVILRDRHVTYTPKIKDSERKALQALESPMPATAWQEASPMAEGTFYKARTSLYESGYVMLKESLYVRTKAGNDLLSLLSGEEKESDESMGQVDKSQLSLLSGGVAPESKESNFVMPESEKATTTVHYATYTEQVQLLPSDATRYGALNSVAPIASDRPRTEGTAARAPESVLRGPVPIILAEERERRSDPKLQILSEEDESPTELHRAATPAYLAKVALETQEPTTLEDILKLPTRPRLKALAKYQGLRTQFQVGETLVGGSPEAWEQLSKEGDSYHVKAAVEMLTRLARLREQE